MRNHALTGCSVRKKLNHRLHTFVCFFLFLFSAFTLHRHCHRLVVVTRAAAIWLRCDSLCPVAALVQAQRQSLSRRAALPFGPRRCRVDAVRSTIATAEQQRGQSGRHIEKQMERTNSRSKRLAGWLADQPILTISERNQPAR